MFHAADAFNALTGTWHFQRSITQHGHATGHACFQVKAADCLLYQEQSIYINPHGNRFNISRNYLYRLQKGQIAIYFLEEHERERLFYRLQLNEPVEQTTCLEGNGIHFCGNDVYQTNFYFYEKNTFRIDYQVSGPKKDYCISTHYQRK